VEGLHFSVLYILRGGREVINGEDLPALLYYE